MDEKKIIVSFLMPVYNASKWLIEALESIKQQLYTDWECIIIDDASTDNTKEILLLLQNDNRFTIIFNNENIGLTKNLNIGINYCKGLFIARMDADDRCFRERLNVQVTYLLNNPVIDVVASNIVIVNDKGLYKKKWPLDLATTTPKKIRSVLPFNNCIAHPSVMIRKSLFQDLKYNELQKNSQDWDLWLQIILANKKIAKIDEVLLEYREHNNSITASSLKQSAYFKKKKFYLNFFKQNLKIRDRNFFLKIKFASFINELFYLAFRVKNFFKIELQKKPY